MPRKIGIFRMLEDQQSLLPQQIPIQYEANDLFAAFQIIRGIRKDHIKLFGATLQIEKNVGLDRIEVFDTQLHGRLTDKIIMYRIDLHRVTLRAPLDANS